MKNCVRDTQKKQKKKTALNIKSYILCFSRRLFQIVYYKKKMWSCHRSYVWNSEQTIDNRSYYTNNLYRRTDILFADEEKHEMFSKR